MEPNADGNLELTNEALELYTGNFDVETVVLLSLKSKGIRTIQNLDLLVNLVSLDASQNLIESTFCFGCLVKLKRLNLKGNRITTVSGLQDLAELEWLNLQDNNIKDLSIFDTLSNLPNLSSLSLQDISKNYANPVCDEPHYMSRALITLPKLRVLDERRIKESKGMQLYNLCHELEDEQTKKRTSGTEGQIVPELTMPCSLFSLEESEKQTYESYKSTLEKCKELEKEAERLLSRLSNSVLSDKKQGLD
eukprot:Colp12_sorted_trinity150504_noHs@12508